MTKKVMLALVCVAATSFARNSYTGGYSGAPGRQTCASSCHGGTGGTIVVSGFPSVYQPGQTYRVVVKRNGGSLIVNYNATTRVGSTANVAGTFTTVTNCALYGGADGGVYASPHAIDSSVFQWTAPAGGTGLVNFYCAGFQGTTSSASGQSTRITLSASESTTGVECESSIPQTLSLGQNYPNPFNPTTVFEVNVPVSQLISVTVYDTRGKEVAALVNNVVTAGVHRVVFHASGLSSGVYFCRLTARSIVQTRKMIVAK